MDLLLTHYIQRSVNFLWVISCGDIYNVVGLRVVGGSDPEKKYEPSHKIENVSNWVKLRVSSLCALWFCGVTFNLGAKVGFASV
jgi:uncharacterized sodium:solute symporter family permease YidK